jgi:hypothetical protein
VELALVVDLVVRWPPAFAVVLVRIALAQHPSACSLCS